MKTLSLFFVAALLVTAFPAAHAQSDSGWWEWAARSDRPTGSIRDVSGPERAEQRRRVERHDERRDRADRRDDRDDDRRDDRYERRRDRSEKGRKKGPKFCRNGAGHPTKGMQWCYDKGFAPRRYDRRAPRWERRTIEDIIFRTPRRDRDPRRANASDISLGDILGRTGLRHLEAMADGPLATRWVVVVPSKNVRVLQIRDRRGPLAELTDLDGDGRVDIFLANSSR